MPRTFAEGHRPRHRTLGWLAEAFYLRSEAEAVAILREHLPESSGERQYIVHTSDAPRVLRTDSPESVGIEYHAYNPPHIWGAGYSIMRVVFPEREPQDFMSHAGEELLLPISGEVQYHFFWAPPGSAPKREQLAEPVVPGELIRINPQIPHHTWAAGESAEAWMIFRDVSAVPAAISLDPAQPTRGPVELHPRVLEADALVDPARYALSAWGISERIRLHRERAGLGVQELSALADVDPAQLSRLETGTRNLSLDALVRITRVLRVPLLDLMETAKWRFMRSLATPTRSPKPVPALPPPSGLRHWLHPARIDLAEGWRGDLGPQGPSSGEFASWILLEGRLLLLGEDASQGSVISAGSVVHFRGSAPRSVETLESCRILEIRDSGSCSCSTDGRLDAA